MNVSLASVSRELTRQGQLIADQNRSQVQALNMTNESLAFCLLGFTKEEALPALYECGFSLRDAPTSDEKGENIEAFVRGEEGVVIYYTRRVISEVYFFLTGEWYSFNDVTYH